MAEEDVSTTATAAPKRKSLHDHALPTKERIVAHVAPPVGHVLTPLLDADGAPRLDALRAHFIAEGRLVVEEVLDVLQRVGDVFRAEPNMVHVPAPVTVCGDIHGQFYDLMKLFEVAGSPKEVSYLFLGDYADRGCFGFETVMFLFCCKLLRPNKFFMLRGNHECRHLTDYFNFKAECIHKYGVQVYDAIMDVYDCLPIAALMNERFFCVHGGLSPHLLMLSDLDAIDRFQEVPSTGLMCDLMWSDPHSTYNEPTGTWAFRENTARGCSFNYSFNAVCDFLDRNDLFCVIRGHEVQYVGYNMYRQNDANGFPSLITLFSAPNYCDDHGNKAAVLEYGDNNVMNIKQFTAVEHPYYLPNFSNVFKWSLPFVAEKIGDLLHGLVKMEEGDIAEELAAADGGADDDLLERQTIIRNKIMAMGRVRMMFSTLRQQRENVIKLKGLTGDNKLPKGVLLAGPKAIEASLDFFQRSKDAHREDEMMPPAEYKTAEERDAIALRESLKMFKGKDGAEG